MSKKLSEGDIVLCQLYNTPEHKFYGDFFKGIIVDTKDTPQVKYRWYKVKDECGYTFTLHRKEIKRRIR